MKVAWPFTAVFGLFAAVVCVTSLAQAQPDFASELQVPWLKLAPAGQGQSKPAGRGPLKLAFGGTLTDKPDSANPEECSNWQLQKQILSHPADFAAQTAEARLFFSRCDTVLRRWAPHSLVALLKLISGNYEILERPHIYEAQFTLPYGAEIHGILALKDVKTPRPFVIVICGTGCELRDSVAREALLAYYDTAPFNVLVLPSITSNAFIRENKTYGIGGFEEGRQTFELVRLLGGNDSPFRKIISSFHIMGQSLGGNGALFAAVYASANNELLTGPKIQSVFGYHPVVDLKSSLMALDRNDLTGRAFAKIIWHSIADNISYVPGMPVPDDKEKFKAGKKKSVHFIQNYVYPRYQKLANEKKFLLAPFSSADLSNPDQFWASNNFLNFYDRVTVPTLLFVADNDFIVDPRVNAQALAKKLNVENQKYVNVLETTHGSHTVFEYVYGHEIFSALAQSFILAQSPEFDLKSRTFSLDMSDFDRVKALKLLTDQERYFGYKWRVERNQTYVTLTFNIWNPELKINNQLSCSTTTPYYAVVNCFRHVDLRIPLEKLHLSPVQTHAEAHAMTRFLNFRVKAVDAKGQDMTNTVAGLHQLQWYDD